MASEKMRRSLEHHAPDEKGVRKVVELRRAALGFADILDTIPPGREKSIAETKLEETLMWAVKAVVVPPES